MNHNLFCLLSKIIYRSSFSTTLGSLPMSMAYILLIVVVFFFFFFFLQSFVATIKRRSEGTNRMVCKFQVLNRWCSIILLYLCLFSVYNSQEISQGSKIAMWLFDFCSLLYANLMLVSIFLFICFHEFTVKNVVSTG